MTGLSVLQYSNVYLSYPHRLWSRAARRHRLGRTARSNARGSGRGLSRSGSLRLLLGERHPDGAADVALSPLQLSLLALLLLAELLKGLRVVAAAQRGRMGKRVSDDEDAYLWPDESPVLSLKLADEAKELAQRGRFSDAFCTAVAERDRARNSRFVNDLKR